MSRIAIVLGSFLIAAITLSTIVFVLRSASDSAEAGTPGVNFAIGIDINGDGTNDCGTGVPRAMGDGAPDVVAAEVTNTTCNAAPGSTLEVRVYLMDKAGAVYYGVGTQIHYSGVNSGGPGRDVWTTLCAYPAVVKPPTPGIKNTGCAANEPRTDVGLMSVFLFVCTASGTLSLDNGPGETALTDNYLVEHRDPGVDELIVNCGAAPMPGDSNCDGVVNSIDASLILQRHAGLIATLPCDAAADVNEDGTINSIDAALILQYEARLIAGLGLAQAGQGGPFPHLPPGDANCSGTLSSLDAVLILQYNARLKNTVPCLSAADANSDRRVDGIDAVIVLQHEAGLGIIHL